MLLLSASYRHARTNEGKKTPSTIDTLKYTPRSDLSRLASSFAMRFCARQPKKKTVPALEDGSPLCGVDATQDKRETGRTILRAHRPR